MAINFEKSTKRTTKQVGIFRERVEKVFNKSFQINQIDRMRVELFLSGYVPSLDEKDITLDILKEYASFKAYFPRVAYNKADLEKAKELVKNEPDNISAKTIYDLIKIIDDRTQDSTIYYWFHRIGSKFTTVGEYSKNVTTIVLYAALRRKSTLKKSA
jgi:hypothetical protein